MTNPADRARVIVFSAEQGVGFASEPIREPVRTLLIRGIESALVAAREAALREAWVPCSERMPDGEARDVLVLIEDGDRVYQDVWHWSPQLGEHSSFRKYVTHWRELPELPPPPPTKGTSDEK